jgi:small conductance mechanosensitive channel
MAEMDNQLDTLTQAKHTLVDLAIRFGPKLVVALLILGVGVLVSRWVGRALHRALARLELEPPVRVLLVRAADVVVFGLFLIMALQNLGVELLPLLAGVGVVGAGVALATQGVLSNAAAGLTIIFTKPYRVGEYVGIVGVEGQVESITLFSTTLLHADRSRVVVPNRKIVGEILHNYGRIRQAELHVGVAYGSDLQAALAAVAEVVQSNAHVLRDPAPLIQIGELAESAVHLTVKAWVAVQDYGLVETDLSVAILGALSRRGIRLPVPQREVRLIDAGR